MLYRLRIPIISVGDNGDFSSHFQPRPAVRRIALISADAFLSQNFGCAS